MYLLSLIFKIIYPYYFHIQTVQGKYTVKPTYSALCLHQPPHLQCKTFVSLTLVVFFNTALLYCFKVSVYCSVLVCSYVIMVIIGIFEVLDQMLVSYLCW